MAITLSDNGNVSIRIATTGGETGNSWTVFPYFKDDPTLEGFPRGDRAIIKVLSIDNTRASGNTDLDKKASAIALVVEALKDIHLTLRDYQNLVVSEIETEDNALTKLLGQEYGIKDKSREQVVSNEAKG